MDQPLDMQVAALIFLAGTRSLVTSDNTGGVETTREDDDESEDPAPYNTNHLFPTDLVNLTCL